MNADDVRKLLAARVEQEGSQFKFAIRNEIHPSAISNYLAGRVSNPTPQILRSLGLKAVMIYEPIPAPSPPTG